MVPKTWRDPGSETLSCFALAGLSGALAVGAVGALDVSLLVYPAYFCLVNFAMALLILERRRVLYGAPRLAFRPGEVDHGLAQPALP